MTDLSATDVIVLAGGYGSRSRKYLGDTPKFLADVQWWKEGKFQHSSPLGQFVLKFLRGHNTARVLLALAHDAGKILQTVSRREIDIPDLDIVPLVEPEPLGTLHTLAYVSSQTALSDPFLVVNGDTLLDLDLGAALSRYAGQPLPVHAREFGVEGFAYSHTGATFLPRDLALSDDAGPNLEDALRAGKHVPYLSGGRYLDLGTPAGWALRGEWFR